MPVYACFLCRCEYQQTLQFGGLIFNTAVHVVMYLYFFLRVVHKPPWWKPLVTKFQIVQFMTSVLCFCYTAYLIFVQKEACHGQGALAVSVQSGLRPYRTAEVPCDVLAIIMWAVRSSRLLTLALLVDCQCNLGFNVTLLYQFVGVSSTNAKAGAAKNGLASKGKAKKAD